MLLSQLQEVNWQVYYDGRAKATNRGFDKEDIREFLLLAINEVWRVLYFASKRNKDGNTFYFVSPTLSIQEFPLGEVNPSGVRVADMSKFDMLRMPHDMHFVNIIPLGDCEGMGKSIPVVEPSEENFYKNKFPFFQFARVSGRNLLTFHVPPCASKVEVESTFTAPHLDPDISPDVAFDASNIVLGRFIGIPEFSNSGKDNPLTPSQKILRQKLPTQQAQIPE